MSQSDLYLKSLISPKSLMQRSDFLEGLVHFTPDGEVEVFSQHGVEYNDSTDDLKILLNGSGDPGSSFVHIRFGYDTSNSSHRRVNSIHETVETPSGVYTIAKVDLEIGGNGQSCVPSTITGLQGALSFNVLGCQDLGVFFKAHPEIKHCDDLRMSKNMEIQCTNVPLMSQLVSIAKKDRLPLDSSFHFFHASCEDELGEASLAAYSKLHKGSASAPAAQPQDSSSGAANFP